MFSRSPIDPVRPSKTAPARSIDRLRDAAGRIARAVPGGGLVGGDTPSGTLPRKPRRDTFHARLTGSGFGSGSAVPYSFTEVYGVPNSTLWATYPGGRTGTNAYEINGVSGLNEKVVELTEVGGGAWYRFVWRWKGGGGGGGGGAGSCVEDLFGGNSTLRVYWYYPVYAEDCATITWIGPVTTTLTYTATLFGLAGYPGYISDFISYPGNYCAECVGGECYPFVVFDWPCGTECPGATFYSTSGDFASGCTGGGFSSCNFVPSSFGFPTAPYDPTKTYFAQYNCDNLAYGYWTIP